MACSWPHRTTGVDGGQSDHPCPHPRDTGAGSTEASQLSAEEVDDWLATKAKTLSTDTLHRLMSILRQSIRRAQARDLVKRNVALLCDVPRGTAGRPSKSLTLAQATDLLAAAQQHPGMHAYIVVSLLTGARTEELRALTWSHTDLDGEPPSMQLWRSMREGGDTKTRLSRRTLELPNECVAALRAHKRWQTQSRMRNAARWPDNDLVFTTQLGTPLDAAKFGAPSVRWPSKLGSKRRNGHRVN